MDQLTDGTTTIDMAVDPLWRDRHAWTPISQTPEYSLGGALILHEGVKLSGQPMTIDAGVVPHSTVLDVESMLDAETLTLTFEGQVYQVTWDHEKGARQAVSVTPDLPAPADDELYRLTLFLLITP